MNIGSGEAGFWPDFLSGLPGGPIGEAWLLSDRDDHPSLVSDGPLKGLTLDQLMKQYPEQLLGQSGRSYDRFPLLLKFLDAHEMLSVQVHPSDEHPELLPAGDTGKTEAWVVLEAGSKSRIYAGLKHGTTADGLRRALAGGIDAVASRLEFFTPKTGATGFFCRREPFILWAATFWRLRFSRTAM